MPKSTGGAGRIPRMRADDGPISVNTEKFIPLHTSIAEGQMFAGIRAKEAKLAEKAAKVARKRSRAK